MPAGLATDTAFVDLGTSFLEKLFGKPDASKRRCELFAACAIIATIGLRGAAKASSAPVFWVRLAALTHAGVLAEALSRIPDTKDFLRWATSRLMPSYIWHSVVDRFESPRWIPTWISPDHLGAELVGRATDALRLLPEEIRPAKWTSIIDEIAERLTEEGEILATIFPGPFDDFRHASAGISSSTFAAAEMELEAASHLMQVPGLFGLVYATKLSERAIKNVLRLVRLLTDELIIDGPAELPYLQASAHAALSAGSETIADAVIDRCLILARDGSGSNIVSDLFAVAAEACATHDDRQKYRKALGDVAARMCFAIDRSDDLTQLQAIMDVLAERDQRLAPALAKAQAIARTKLGRQ
ncbi:hypothetical protein [Mesorhizobium australicum]|uniref:hypothetical protein n=1 Tax=Mesorhizobium australicum TaxID=536018 RepID=UPI00333966EB